MNPIKSIKVDIINDSRNIPTLSVTVTTEESKTGNCMVPSGASTGKYEAYELRDDDTSHGGVTKAKENILEIIAPVIIGKDVTNQKNIDDTLIKLDGTKNKSKLGGNSILGVSFACGKAGASTMGKEFYEYMRMLAEVSPNEICPLLYFNLINGGKHAKTGLAFQEYHIVPKVDSVTEALDIAQKIENILGEIIKEKYGDVEKGDEGGYAVPTENIREPLELLSQAVKKSGLESDIMFALDVAATSFYDEVTKTYKVGDERHTKEELHDTYVSLAEAFPILSIEDPFYEEDFESFAKLKQDLSKVIIVGDDLTVTNIERVKKAHELGSISGLIVKPNQIGTLTETLDVITYAQKNGIHCIVSHRSGETMDDMIADITEAFHCFGMKSGARGPKEREVKYARLVKIHNNKNSN
ncbi:MAG: phosphopyruvate hydratase [Candidatus Paceibacterota bacterium]|jgi:enolase